jgi:hypothetical protein
VERRHLKIAVALAIVPIMVLIFVGIPPASPGSHPPSPPDPAQRYIAVDRSTGAEWIGYDGLAYRPARP